MEREMFVFPPKAKPAASGGIDSFRPLDEESVASTSSEFAKTTLFENTRLQYASEYLFNYLRLNEKSLFERIDKGADGFSKLTEEDITKLVTQISLKDRLRSSVEIERKFVCMVVRLLQSLVKRYAYNLGPSFDHEAILKELNQMLETFEALNLDIFVLQGLLDKDIIEKHKGPTSPFKMLITSLVPAFISVGYNIVLNELTQEPTAKKPKTEPMK